MRPVLLVLSLLLALPAFASSLSLKETLRFAMANAPDLASDKERAAISDLEVSTARAKLLPSLDVSGTHGIDKRKPAAFTDPWSSSVTLGVTENLYDNGRTINRLKIANVARDMNELSAVRTRDRLALDVVTRFNAYSMAAKLADVRKQQVALYRKQYNAAEAQFGQGLRTKRDFLRFKTQLQRAELDLADSVSSVARAVYELRSTIGAPTKDEDAPEFAVEEAKVKASDVPAAMPPVEGSYEFRIARLRADQTPYEVRLARREWLPRAEVTMGANYTNSAYLGSGLPFRQGESYGWSVLLTLSYNIWDWGQRARDVAIAEKRQTIAENDVRRAALDTQKEIKGMMLELQQLRGNFLLNKDLLDSAEEGMAFVRREYQEGKVQTNELIQAVGDLLDAQVRFFTARYNLASAIARHEYYSGSLYGKLGLD